MRRFQEPPKPLMRWRTYRKKLSRCCSPLFDECRSRPAMLLHAARGPGRRGLRGTVRRGIHRLVGAGAPRTSPSVRPGRGRLPQWVVRKRSVLLLHQAGSPRAGATAGLSAARKDDLRCREHRKQGEYRHEPPASPTRPMHLSEPACPDARHRSSSAMPWDAGSTRILAGLGYSRDRHLQRRPWRGRLDGRDGQVTRQEALAHCRAIVVGDGSPGFCGSRKRLFRRCPPMWRKPSGMAADNRPRRRLDRRCDRGSRARPIYPLR